MTVSCDGGLAVTTSGDELGLVWDLPLGKRRQSLTGHSGEVSASILTRKARWGSLGYGSMVQDHSALKTAKLDVYPPCRSAAPLL